jgi:hypothetical protein
MVSFDAAGDDRASFPPLRLTDLAAEARYLEAQGWDPQGVRSPYARRVSLEDLHLVLDGAERVSGDFYLHGYGVEALYRAQLVQHGEPVHADGEFCEAEADAFYAYFVDPARAEAVADRFAQALRSPDSVEGLVKIARDAGLAP